MTEYRARNFLAALRDFQTARFRANMEQLMARLSGKSADLLSFEEVRRQLRGHATFRRELKDIPLDAIVGSVDRYTDFTRRFYPRQDSDQRRWARIEMQATGMEGLPPIEVYQIGEAYFVIDGNHRVSVARQLDNSHIEAYVTQVETKAPLTPESDFNDIIRKARHLDFLERTRLDELRPEADFSMSVPGHYRILDKHIELHRYMMSLEQDREIPCEEAVTDWHDNIYSVVVQAIREQGLLQEYPNRTETDLYLWISGYRTFLEEELGWDIDPPPKSPLRTASRLQKFISRLLPGETETPLPGEWRREHMLSLLHSHTGRPFRLFANILVPVNGQEVGWYALYQALGVARREGGRILGLHVVAEAAEKESQAVQTIRAEFNQRCVKAGVPGRLAVEVGEIPDVICHRARWVDLVVIRLTYPPPPRPIARLGSGIHTLLRRCRSPILAVPRNYVYPLDRLLLAYDHSPKAREALYIATYLADRWTIPLTVLTVLSADRSDEALQKAQAYLKNSSISVAYRQEKGAVAETILAVAEEEESSLIIMGGYSHDSMLELVLGSAVDEVLRHSRRPLLICR